MTEPIDPADLDRLARARLPIPDRSASPWPEEPSRSGRHDPPLNKIRVPAEFSAKVVGMSFVAGYVDNVDRLEVGLANRTVDCRIVREPDNPYDRNAVRVDMIDGDGEIVELGHLPAALAARLAPPLDAGIVWEVVNVEVLRTPAHPDRPGVSLSLRRA